MTGNTEGANNTEFALNLPYRGLARFTGAVTEVQVKALLRAANREKGGLHGLGLRIYAQKIGLQFFLFDISYTLC